MHASILTREYPPSVYGGAGVHVAQLVPRLRDLIDVDVQCMGEPRDGVVAHAEDFPPGANAALRVLGADLSMVSALPDDTDLVHSHTWYANMAGHLGGLFRSIPHVVTAHSLEPLRPWKREQLGGGYELSSWAERTAYEGVPCQALPEAIRACRGHVLPERLADAARDARARGLITRAEAAELEEDMA